MPKTFQRCEYRELKNSQDIRVLCILPGDETDELRCVLKHIRFKNRFPRKIPDYLALSYAWGSPEDTRTIRCDYGGKEGYVIIPSNLYHALLRLRLRRRLIRRVWADAICINQEDVQERSQQVQMMRQIFAHASAVPIWLGKGTERSKETCELIDAMAEYYSTEEFDSADPFGTHPELSDSEWILYKEFFQCAWFTRAWVFQEAVVARKLVFTWGEWAAPWEMIMLIIHCIGTFRNPVSEDPVANQSGRQLKAMERERLENTTEYDRNKDKYNSQIRALVYILDRSRHLKATDPRDRIFALRGLSQERDNPSFPVNYSLSAEQVYRDFAKYELFQRQDLNILSSATAATYLDLPSWVPDWTYCPAERYPLASSSEMQLWLSAGVLFGKPCLRLSDNQRILYVKGIIFTTPRIIGPINQVHLHCHGIDSGSIERVFHGNSSFYKETYRIASHAPDPYPNGEPRIEAYVRTLNYDYISWHKRITNAEPATMADGMKFLAKYNVIDAAPITETDHGLSAFESRVERGRRFSLTENGHFGWAPQAVENTDRIAAFVGGNILYVLRPVGNGTYRLIGECYLHGAKYSGGQELEEIPPV